MKAGTRLQIRILALLAALSVGLCPAGGVCDPGADELRRVKAAFVLNIARFVAWPADAFAGNADALHLCLYRSNPLGSAIETIRGKKVGKRSLSVSTIRDIGRGRECQILFVPPAELGRFAGGPPSATQPILTLTDATSDDAAARRRDNAVMVTLVRNGTRIGFEIDLPRVRRAGLRMSAELLKLARIVGDSSGGDAR